MTVVNILRKEHELIPDGAYVAYHFTPVLTRSNASVDYAGGDPTHNIANISEEGFRIKQGPAFHDNLHGKRFFYLSYVLICLNLYKA